MNALLCVTLLCGCGAAAAPLPEGKGEVVCQLGGYELTVFTYRPAQYAAASSPLIVVFHGMGRNADEYRDNAVPLADGCGGLVIAPHFDSERFPLEAYNYGNLMAAGVPQPSENWTFRLVPQLIDEIRRREGRPEMPYYLIGHSAGGQFVERLIAFVELKPVAVLAANPGSHQFPTTELPFPYGFGELPESLAGDAALERYLAMPLTIYLGTADTDTKTSSLDKSDTALRQGPHRLARGHACYTAARQLAADRGWTCNWQLAEAPDVGHSARDMFRHPHALPALLRNGRPQ